MEFKVVTWNVLCENWMGHFRHSQITLYMYTVHVRILACRKNTFSARGRKKPFFSTGRKTLLDDRCDGREKAFIRSEVENSNFGTRSKWRVFLTRVFFLSERRRTSIFSPGTGRLLGPQPLQHFQVTTTGSTRTCRYAARERWISPLRPSQHLQQASFSSHIAHLHAVSMTSQETAPHRLRPLYHRHWSDELGLRRNQRNTHLLHPGTRQRPKRQEQWQDGGDKLRLGELLLGTSGARSFKTS